MARSWGLYSSQKAIICEEDRLAGIKKTGRGMYIVSKPVILQRIDVLFRYYFPISSAAQPRPYLESTHIAHRNLPSQC